MMFVRLAKAYELIERLNAEYYSPASVENQKKIDRIGTERFDLFYGKTGIGHTASVEPHYAASGERSVHFASGKAIRDGIFDIDKCEKIKLSSHQGMLSKSRVSAGDLLIIRKGDSGSSCVIPESVGECNCSSEVIYFKDISPVDAYFISTFLNSSHGRIAFKRLQRGTLIPGVSLLDIPEFGIVDIDEEAKKYIGDKVRQAERLRAWAKETEARVKAAIPRYLSQVPSYGKRHFYSERSVLNPLRLDAAFYHPDHVELDSKLRTVGYTSLGTKCVQIKAGWNNQAVSFSYFEIGGLNVSNGTIEPSIINTNEAPSRAKTGIQQGDVLVSTVRPNRKNVAFVSEDFSPVPMVATSGFSVLRFASLESAAFYHAWLRSDDATHQLMRWNSGSAYPAIDDDVPLKILVPEFDEQFVSEWGAKLLSSHNALSIAKYLVQSAKLLVEALIDGAVTERQFIDAQKSLDAGDTSLDREMLARLTTKGLDGDGDPLFSDLDQLYELLAQSQSLDE